MRETERSKKDLIESGWGSKEGICGDHSLKNDGLRLISTTHERVDISSKLVRMGLQRGFATVSGVVGGVVGARTCLVFALRVVVEITHMLEWVYDDKSRGRGCETSVGLVMAEASVEEGENRVVCWIN